jgi:ATP-dependent helicase/nuclease subunit A
MSVRPALLRPLKGAQADASHPKRQVWLSASAGTGKTHVLTARVLRLLLTGANPDAILCLTFTKAGAAEMSARIQSRLARWVRMLEQDLKKELFALGEPNDEEAVRKARRLFARVLDAPGGGLRIQTIHAFAQTLLAAFPVEAGLAPGFRPLDGRAEAALVRATLGRMLVEAERGGDLGLIRDVQVLSRRLGEGGAESQLVACARAPDAFAELGAREGIEARVRSALGLPLGDIEEHIVQQVGDDCFDVVCLRRIAEANRGWGTKQGLDRAAIIETWLAAAPPERAATLEALHQVWAKKEGDPRSFGKGQAPQVPHYEPDCTGAHACCDALLALRTGAALAALIAAGLRAGQAFAAAYGAAKRAAGAVDFDDLIRLTLGLIEQPGIGEWIRYKLDRRTDHVLIDEGQDTNIAQWRIVKALADEFFSEKVDADARVRTIFSVGDFKQAIFGFQGTDPAAFDLARTYFTLAARQGEQRLVDLSLDQSFRSSPPVLTVVDRLIADIGGAAMGLIEEARPHVSAKAHLPGLVTLWSPVSAENAEDVDEGEEGWLDDAQRLFAKTLARQVREWLEEPLWLPGKGRPLRPEDILILVRKRGDLASLIVARLHAEKVPVAGVDRLRLSAPLAVKDLMAAVRFALQPGDDLTLGSLLVSPLMGLTQDDLYRVAFERKGSLWSAFQAMPEYAALTGALHGVLNAADFTTPYQFLERILSGEIGGRRKLVDRLGPESLDPIEELLNAALAFESEATPTLQRFLDWFDRGEVEVTRDPSAPLDAVRVMTVHGAKGLQAPLVILADATGNPDTSPARGLSWEMEEGAALPIVRPRKAELIGPLVERVAANEAREREEHWRLLYVAATRAEEQLVIGGALDTRAKGVPPPSSWYAALDRVLDGLGAEQAPDPLWGGARHYRGDVAARARTSVARPKSPAIPPRLPAWARQPAPVEARPPRPLTPSAPQEDATPLPPPGPAMRAAAKRGKLLHALFQRLPDVAIDQREAAATAWLLGAGGVESRDEAEAIVVDACRIIADPAFATLFGPDALAEAPITATLANGIVVAGTVDRLLVEPERVLVVDFKTGRAVPSSAATVPTGHIEQMSAYVEALRVIFPDRPVEAAVLYTAAPQLLPLDDATLAAHKPGYRAMQQNLALGG